MSWFKNNNKISLLVVFVFILSLIHFSCCAYNNPLDLTVRKSPRWNLPLIGVGMACNGCPPRSCEEDPAIIYGYCCGCARGLDRLPVLCTRFSLINCPLNLAPLCHDYEYMMHCCC